MSRVCGLGAKLLSIDSQRLVRLVTSCPLAVSCVAIIFMSSLSAHARWTEPPIQSALNASSEFDTGVYTGATYKNFKLGTSFKSFREAINQMALPEGPHLVVNSNDDPGKITTWALAYQSFAGYRVPPVRFVFVLDKDVYRLQKISIRPQGRTAISAALQALIQKYGEPQQTANGASVFWVQNGSPKTAIFLSGTELNAEIDYVHPELLLLAESQERAKSAKTVRVNPNDQ